MSHMTTHALRTQTASAQIAILQTQMSLPTVARLALTLAVVVTKWDKYLRTRRTLSRLDPHELDDIGVTRSSANAEAAKPFWQD